MANYTCPDGCPLYGAVEAAERPWREDAASAKHSKKWCIAGRVSPPGRGRVAGGGGVAAPRYTAHNTEGHVLRFNPRQSGGRWFICMVTINASALWAGSGRSARPLFTGTLHHYARIRVVLCWAVSWSASWNATTTFTDVRFSKKPKTCTNFTFVFVGLRFNCQFYGLVRLRHKNTRLGFGK